MNFGNFKNRKISDIYYPSHQPDKILTEKKIKPKGFYFKNSLGFLLVLFLLGGLMVYASSPKLIILLTPFQEEFLIQEKITVDLNVSNPDFENLVIPGKEIEIERIETGVYQSTGEKTIEGKASGIIRVYNNYSEEPQILVARTRFLSPDGKLFRTTKRIVVPGAKYQQGKLVPSYTEVKVVAAEPGEEYNIGPTTFSIPGFAGTPKYTGFYGKSLEPMSGGFRKIVKVITEEDIEKGKNELKEKAQKNGLKELEKMTSKDYLILDRTFEQEVLEDLSLIEPGTEAENFTLKIKVRSKVVSISQAFLEQLGEKIARENLPETKEITPHSLKIQHKVTSFDKERKKAILDLEITGRSYHKITKEEVLPKLQSQELKLVGGILNENNYFQKIEIKKKPFWLKKVPSKANQIEIRIKLD